MIVKFAVVGMVLLSPANGRNPGLADWKVVSSHDSREACTKAVEVFSGDPSFQDLQCVELRRTAPSRR